MEFQQFVDEISPPKRGLLGLDAVILEGSSIILRYDDLEQNRSENLVVDVANPANYHYIASHYRERIGSEIYRSELLTAKQMGPSQQDYSRLRKWPYAHQVVGVERLLPSLFFGLFDEMGAGKTKQVIDTFFMLYLLGVIERVIVVAPNAVRDVWFDRELGELHNHMWQGVSLLVKKFHSAIDEWDYRDGSNEPLRVTVTNYEFLRSQHRLAQITHFAQRGKTLLVLDESAAVKNSQAQQTKAVMKLRTLCDRVLLLNGTPIAHSPMDMFSQGNLLHETILQCRTITHYKARYATLGGWHNKVVIGWHHLEDLQQRFAPYVLRRLKKDCLDLPAKLPSVMLNATLEQRTWEIYKQMRDDLVAWLSEGTISTAQQAAVKMLRLQQICCGFVGGLETVNVEDDAFEPAAVQQVGSEKQQLLLDWLPERLDIDPNLKLILFCRFRPQVAAMAQAISAKFPQVAIGLLHGGQKQHDRDATLRLLHPQTAPKGPAFVIGTQSTGKMAFNLAAADHVIYASNDPSLFIRQQSEDRAHRPGQTRAVNYFDIMATGPSGQKTIDHVLHKGRLNREEVANYTMSAWVKALLTE